MTANRLFPATNGPAAATVYTGPFIAGVNFTVSGGAWVDGLWWWCCGTGQSTAPVNTAVWAVTGATAGTVVTGTVTTSGTLSNVPVGGEVGGHWNFIAFGTSVQLTAGVTYCAQIGSPNNFPFTANSFGSGQTYAHGITAGNLTAYADGTAGGSPAAPFGRGQGVFSTASSNASANLCSQLSSSGNCWVDPQINTLPPASQKTFSLYGAASAITVTPATVADTAGVGYDVCTVIKVTPPPGFNVQAVRGWYYSPPGAAALAASYTVWNPATKLPLLRNASPSWSGAAGSKWVSTPLAGVIPAGIYPCGVFVASGANSAKDASTSFWGPGGAGAAGITCGPLSAPPQATAPVVYEYDNTAPGATPPYTNGTMEPGQCIFGQLPSNGDTFPQLYVDALFQNYWTDLEVSLQPSGLLMASYI